mmetsp:Transcript_31317/g.87826  ORF Transcript_31317/g.87826 Transcript_31317/m.87826 type:complete len:210 (+) Transcript_31317:301-930(+)
MARKRLAFTSLFFANSTSSLSMRATSPAVARSSMKSSSGTRKFPSSASAQALASMQRTSCTASPPAASSVRRRRSIEYCCRNSLARIFSSILAASSSKYCEMRLYTEKSFTMHPFIFLMLSSTTTISTNAARSIKYALVHTWGASGFPIRSAIVSNVVRRKRVSSSAYTIRFRTFSNSGFSTPNCARSISSFSRSEPDRICEVALDMER